jgi:hypothetical protein
VNDSFEGDLIRPLGLVTLYFGYAEFEVDALLNALESAGFPVDISSTIPLGRKLALVRDVLSRRQIPEAIQVISIIDEAKSMIELRNMLVHSSIVAGGRVTPSDKAQPEITVTPDQLVRLADAIFTWKERLSIARQLKLMPALHLIGNSGA